MQGKGVDERAIVGSACLVLVGLAVFILLLGERDPPGGVVSGRVITASGQIPWRFDEHPKVFASWGQNQGKYGSASAQIAHDGRYRLVGLPEGVDLHVWLQWGLAATRGFIDPPRRHGVRAGAGDVDFVLRPGDEIAGRVVERTGSVPRERYVVLAYPLDPIYEPHIIGIDWTSDDGRFRIRGLPPGPHVVRVRTLPPEGRARVKHHATWLIVHESRHNAGARDVRLVLPERRDTQLRLLHEKERWSGTLMLYRAGTTDWVGYWRFFDHEGPPKVLRRLPVGQRHSLVVLPDDEECVAFGRDVRAGDAVTLSFGPTKPFAGRIRRPAGDPRPVLGSVYAISKLTCFHMWIEDGGRFEAATGIYPGRYEIRYRLQNGTEQVLARDVRAGRANLDLMLR